MDVIDFVVGKTYDIDTYAPSELGGDFKKVKVLAVLNGDTAAAFDNIVNKHSRVYGHLPEGSLKDAYQLTYIYVESNSGNKTVLATSWIKSSSPIDAIKATFVVNGLGTTDVSRISELLIENGYSEFTVNT